MIRFDHISKSGLLLTPEGEGPESGYHTSDLKRRGSDAEDGNRWNRVTVAGVVGRTAVGAGIVREETDNQLVYPTTVLE